MSREPTILYLHGLESSPQGRKGTWLSERYKVRSPQLDATDMIRLRDEALAGSWSWDPGDPRMRAALEVPYQQCVDAIQRDPRPALVIGSSFGGGLLLELLHRGAWSGACLFLAQAGLRITPHQTLPRDVPAILIHGAYDDVIPCADSENLVANSSSSASLWRVDDDHMLRSILEDGTLVRAIYDLLEP